MELGERMKKYEEVSATKLLRRVPVIMRLDGKAFHTFTKGFDKPWDRDLNYAMLDTAKYLCENIQGAKIAYTQSDEITILITDYDDIETCGWFDYKVQKMTSIAASMATVIFNNSIKSHTTTVTRKKPAFFDCRVFNVPKEEVVNNFIWRQLDAIRNSIQGLGQANFYHKELQNKSCIDIKNMLLTKANINWDNYETWQKQGVCIIKETCVSYNECGDKIMGNKWETDWDTPIFTMNREYISKLI